MGELTEKKREAEPKSDFGLPGERKYPMPDESHARNAKARASQQMKKGNLSAREKEKIDRKADRILGQVGLTRPSPDTAHGSRLSHLRSDSRQAATSGGVS